MRIFCPARHSAEIKYKHEYCFHSGLLLKNGKTEMSEWAPVHIFMLPNWRGWAQNARSKSFYGGVFKITLLSDSSRQQPIFSSF